MISLRNNQKGRALDELLPVSSEVTERSSLFFVGDKSVIPEVLKKQKVEAQHSCQPGSTETPAESFLEEKLEENAAREI